MWDMLVNAAIFVLCFLFTLTIPLNIWAKIRDDDWRVRWDLEQAERKRKEATGDEPTS